MTMALGFAALGEDCLLAETVTPVPAAMRAFNQLKQSCLFFDRLWITKTGIFLHRSGKNNWWAAFTGGRMAMAGEYSARWGPSLWCINHQ